MKRLSLFALVGLLTLAACTGKKTSSYLQATRSAESIAVSPEALDDSTFWTYFVSTYLDASYAGYIKFTLELDEKGQIETLIWHPSQYSYHADYLKTLPAYSGMTSAQIDAIALHNEGRKIILGTALAVKDEYFSNSEWDFQIVGEDPLSPALIADVMKAVQPHIPNATPEKSFYLPAPTQIAYANGEAAAFAALGVKLAQRQATENRVCYAGGWGAGYVKILNAAELEKALAEGSIQSDEILVLESIPRELPAVAGIIIASPSSPSSHPALLAQMLGIPYFFEKDAMTSESWKKYAASREPVFVSAKMVPNQSCEILIRDGQSLSGEDVSRLALLKKPLPLALSPYDKTLPSAPLDLNQLGMQDGGRVGAKAANVAELRRLIPENTIQEGLALPLSAFSRFIETAKRSDGSALKSKYEALLSQLLQPQLSLSATLPLLNELRTLIEKASITEEQSVEILRGIESTFPKGTRIKLRSSSNIEDLPEFNGAGLYESKGACVGDDGSKVGLCEEERDEVLKAVKKVWASVYTMKAWIARRTFSLEEANVGMGVLIQRSYKGELANGVALAQYPEGAYFEQEGLPDIEVVSTGFPGEDDSVTNPPAGKIPETIRLQKETAEVIVASSEVPRGQKLLSDAANRSLYELIETIYRHYETINKPADRRGYVLDLEWKLIQENGNEKIVIKQVRPVPNPSQSTQGLGFGSMIIGETKGLLCPTIQENPDALSKLQLSFPMSIAVGLHEVKSDDSARMKSPILSLSSSKGAVEFSTDAEVKGSEWSEEWGTSNEYRYVTVSSHLQQAGEDYELSWKLKQTRALAEKNRLVDGVQSLWALDFALSQGDKKQAYVLVVGAESCDSDSYQGLTPGAYNASLSYAQGRKPPVDFVETYESVNGEPLSFAIQAKTSFQGFDKTRFLGISEVTINGLLDRSITLPRGSAVYAPGHHNFQWAYAFDVFAVKDLSVAEKDALLARGIRYLLLDNPGEGFSSPFGEGQEFPSFDFPMARQLETKERTFKVYGVNEAGVRTEIGEVRLASGTNPFPIGI